MCQFGFLRTTRTTVSYWVHLGISDTFGPQQPAPKKYPDIRYLDFQMSYVLVYTMSCAVVVGGIGRSQHPGTCFSRKTAKNTRKNQKLVTTGTCVTQRVSVDSNWCRNPRSQILADVVSGFHRPCLLRCTSFRSGLLCRSKISQRFQKSYLEQSAMRLKIRKIQNQVFFWVYKISVYCYVYRPFTVNVSTFGSNEANRNCK